MPNTANLRPFSKGDGRASEAGRKGVAVREANRAARVGDTTALCAELDRVVSSFKREDLGTQAAAVAALLLARVAAGAIVVKGPDVAALVRVLVDVARLEAGESTSNALVAHVSSSDALERVRALREQARTTLGAVVVASATGLDALELEPASAAAVAVADGASSGGIVGGRGE